MTPTAAAPEASASLATPALREMLLRRNPSGLFETRLSAVEALALVDAPDVLIEFL